MGCHTWSYRKLLVSDETKQKIREAFEKRYNEIFSLPDRQLFENWKNELRSCYPDVSEEIIEPQISLQEYAEELEETRQELRKGNILEKIKNGDFTNAEILINFDNFIEHDDELLTFYNGEFYIEDSELASDMFRVDYTDKMFTDAESLISWLETQKYVGYYKEDYSKNLGLCDELRERIRKVFKENPDILIEFG